MAKIGCLKPFRGSYDDIKLTVLEEGEIAFVKDKQVIYMGDGTHTISELIPYSPLFHDGSMGAIDGSATTPSDYNYGLTMQSFGGASSGFPYSYGQLVTVKNNSRFEQICFDHDENDVSIRKYDSTKGLSSWRQLAGHIHKVFNRKTTDLSPYLNNGSKTGIVILSPNSTGNGLASVYVIFGGGAGVTTIKEAPTSGYYAHLNNDLTVTTNIEWYYLDVVYSRGSL